MESAVSRRDRIVTSAIEIICDSGLEALTTKTLAMKENMNEALLYKYFGGIEEVLVAVIDQYVQFDDSIASTIKGRKASYVDKLKEYFDTYATYYGNYVEISTIELNCESLLHNYDVREKIASSISIKRKTVEDLIAGAIEAKEITNYYSPSELATILLGSLQGILLDRRVHYHEKGLKEEISVLLSKTLDGLVMHKDVQV